MKELYFNENEQSLFCSTNLIKTQLPSPTLNTKVTYDVWVALFSGLFGSTSLFPLKEKKKMTSEMGQYGNCLDVTRPTLHSSLTLAALATRADCCRGNHGAAGAFASRGQPWLDFSCHCHTDSGIVRQKNSTRKAV